MKEQIETSAQQQNILFVATTSPLHTAMGESLGIEALAGHLDHIYGNNITTNFFDFQLRKPEELREKIIETNPNILAISVKIGSLDQLDFIVNTLSSISKTRQEKQPQIIMGGVVPTFVPEDLLTRYPNTLMAIGEGETTMDALVRGDPLETIPNLVYQKDGALIKTKRAMLPLSELHLPKRATAKEVYANGGMIWAESSRGCDKHCTFCSKDRIRDKKGFEPIPLDLVLEDAKQLTLMGIKEFSYTDPDTIGNDIKRANNLSKRMIEEKLKIHFSISTRADAVFSEDDPNSNRERVKMFANLKKAGLIRVFLGIESGSNMQLKRYAKGCNIETNYKALKILRSLGIDVVAGWIPIDQLTTVDELLENLDFCINTGLFKKVSNPLSVLRVQEGSSYKTLLQKKNLLRSKTPELVFYQASFADPLVEKIANISTEIVNNVYPFIFGLKGEVARETLTENNDKEPKLIESWLHHFREKEIKLLRNIARDVKFHNGLNIDSIVEEFNVSRYKDLSLIKTQIENGIIKNKSHLLPHLNEALSNIAYCCPLKLQAS